MKHHLQTLGRWLALELWALLHKLQRSEGDITAYDHALWWIEGKISHLWNISYYDSDQEVFDVLDWGVDFTPAEAARYLTDRQRFCLAIVNTIH